MHGKKLVGAGALALAMAAGVGGPAQAAGDPAADYEGITVSGLVGNVGDEVKVRCPDGWHVEGGLLTGASNGAKGMNRYRSEPLPDGSGWVVRVESTENTGPWATGPWTISVGAICSDQEIETRPGQDIVEVAGLLTKRGDVVSATCSAGESPDRSLEVEGLPPGDQVTIDRTVENGVTVMACAKWKSEPTVIVVRVGCT